MDINLIIKLLILVIAAILLGYKLGVKSQQHTYGGEIVFVKHPGGKEQCIFRLESDDDWLSRQKSVVFRIEHSGLDTQSHDNACS